MPSNLYAGFRTIDLIKSSTPEGEGGMDAARHTAIWGVGEHGEANTNWYQVRTGTSEYGPCSITSCVGKIRMTPLCSLCMHTRVEMAVVCTRCHPSSCFEMVLFLFWFW